MEIMLKLRVFFQKMNSNIEMPVNKCKLSTSYAVPPAVGKASGHGFQFIRSLYCPLQNRSKENPQIDGERVGTKE